MMDNTLSLLPLGKASRLPVLRQTGATESGLVCLAMVLHYHGQKTELASLRRRFTFSLTGATLLDLIRTGDELGLTSRPLKAPISALAKLQTPCILHWDLRHFVVLKKVTRHGLVIHDPAKGLRSVSFEDAERAYSGVALELTPAIDFEHRHEQRRLRIGQLWHKAFGLKSNIGFVIGISLLLQLLAIATPFYAQLVIDNVLIREDFNLLNLLAVGFCLIYGLKVLSEIVRSYATMYLSNQLSYQMTVNVFRHLLKLPGSYFLTRHTSDIISRFASIKQVKGILTTGVITAIVDGFMAIGVLLMMLVYSPALTLLVLAAAGGYLLLRTGCFGQMREVTAKEINAQAEENRHVMETVKAIKSIKIFAKEPDRLNLWQHKFADVIDQGIRQNKLNISFKASSEMLCGIEYALVVFLGARMIMTGELSLGMLVAFIAYKDSFLKSTFCLIEKIIEFKMLDLHLERISDVVFSDIEDQGDFTHNPQPFRQLRCVQLSFRYPDSEAAIFDNLSLSIKRGESIAITGPSGCGKTTLLNLLMGVMEPSSGTLAVDDQSIRQYGLCNYRRQIAAVTQDDQLLSGTVAENISFFSQEVDNDWMAQCARTAAIYEDIVKMPKGFESVVGDMGARLSGGQKQRILLARALYKRPKILFLDEATSYLDDNTESLINTAIKQLEMTLITITHTQQSIVAADRILTFEQDGIKDVTDQYKQKYQAA